MAKRPKYLVIVESPAKCKTIHKYLGDDYAVKSSMGHVMDLPQKDLGIEIPNDFKPRYVRVPGRKRVIADLEKSAKDAERIFLAPDPDREGEAIAWHLANLLTESAPEKRDRFYRVTFNEITQKAVQEAFAHPERINMDRVNAQQARRILDRIVGYKISPLLWKKVGSGLSAGRVQSVALRLICEREAEIRIFVPEEYWSIDADLQKEGEVVFRAKLEKINGEKFSVTKKEQADVIVNEIKQETFIVGKVTKRKRKRNPTAPFTTSQLQQQSANKLYYTARKTMMIAQELYEGIAIGGEDTVGLITYMRTDSLNVSPTAREEAAEYIKKTFGESYCPDKPPIYKTRKKNVQEAHEAIRPTLAERSPDSIKKYLSKDQFKLYSLIWKQFISSQMTPAQLEVVSVDIEAGKKYLFRASGTTILFDGFLILFKDEMDAQKDKKKNNDAEDDKEDTGRDNALPPLSTSDPLKLLALLPEQHFTKPPPRFSEATLVRALEEYGIGRPSTYAAIISTIQNREYVEKDNRRFFPTALGKIVNDMLVEHFEDVVNVEFTAGLEDKLDLIEESKNDWVSVIKGFYEKFDADMQMAQEKLRNVKKVSIPTDHVCEKCSKPMVIKMGRFGQFLSCSDYPTCTFAKPLTTMVPCPEEGCKGELIRRKSKKGRVFYGCSAYPKCEYKTNRLPKPDTQEDEDA